MRGSVQEVTGSSERSRRQRSYSPETGRVALARSHIGLNGRPIWSLLIRLAFLGPPKSIRAPVGGPILKSGCAEGAEEGWSGGWTAGTGLRGDLVLRSGLGARSSGRVPALRGEVGRASGVRTARRS